MDVPAPIAGTVTEVLVKVGDQVSEGTADPAICRRRRARSPRRRRWSSSRSRRPPPREAGADRGRARRSRAARGGDQDDAAPAGAHAGPSVRRMARELGVDLAASRAPGEKGRITKDDVLAFLKGPAEPRRRGGGACRGCGHPGDPGAGLLEVRSGREQPSCRGSSGCRARSCTALAQRPARHAARRGRHHRARRLPQGARHRGQGREETLPGHAAGVPDEGGGLGAEAVPRVQQLARPGEGRADPQELLQHRHRGRHARRAWSCRSSRTSTARASSSSPASSATLSGKARDGKLAPPTCRAAPSPSPASAASAAPASPRSSTRPRWRSWAWCARR